MRIQCYLSIIVASGITFGWLAEMAAELRAAARALEGQREERGADQPAEVVGEHGARRDPLGGQAARHPVPAGEGGADEGDG